MTETQLDAWRQELDTLWEKTIPDQAHELYASGLNAYKLRKAEINLGLMFFQFRYDSEYEGTHILVPKVRKVDAFRGLSIMGE